MVDNRFSAVTTNKEMQGRMETSKRQRPPGPKQPSQVLTDGDAEEAVDVPRGRRRQTPQSAAGPGPLRHAWHGPQGNGGELQADGAQRKIQR